jgi:stringent starvation protein B
MSEAAIPSIKPFLIRAIYEWCMDSGFTPYMSVVVDASTRVPMEHVRNGEIVLNIGPLAANKLQLGNEFVELQARFGGIAREIFVPIAAVSAVYARENGRGMSFDSDQRQATAFAPEGVALVSPAPAESGGVPADKPTPTDTPPDTPPDIPPRPSGKPTLRRIK